MRFDIKGLDKVTVFRALYERAQPQGCSHLSYVPGPLSGKEAQSLLEASEGSFSFVKGRLMRINLSGNDLDTDAYDRSNGQGAALSALRAKFPGFPERPS